MLLVLTLLIGALVGLAIVAFILVTERFAAKLYPPDGAAWRRLFVPVIGSLGMGYLLYGFFPNLLPVVSRANVHQLEGMVTLQDVLALYGVSAKESLQTGKQSH